MTLQRFQCATATFRDRFRENRHRRLVVVAAGAAVVVLVVVVAVALWPGAGSPGRRSTPVIDTHAAPAATRWESYRGVAVPFSSGAGPHHLDGDIPSGFADTPQGAVVAAMQDQARLSLAPDDTWAALTRQVVVPGAGRDAFATARAQLSITAPANPATTAQYAGFRLEHYSPSAVTVWLATRMPDTALTAQPTALHWAGGDWHVVLPDPNPQASAAAPVSTDPVPVASLSADGYTPFSAH